MASIVRHAFTRADSSSLGSPWTAHAGGSWGIGANRAKWIVGSGTGRGAGRRPRITVPDMRVGMVGHRHEARPTRSSVDLDIDNFWMASGTGAPALTANPDAITASSDGTVTETYLMPMG